LSDSQYRTTRNSPSFGLPQSIFYLLAIGKQPFNGDPKSLRNACLANLGYGQAALSFTNRLGRDLGPAGKLLHGPALFLNPNLPQGSIRGQYAVFELVLWHICLYTIIPLICQQYCS